MATVLIPLPRRDFDPSEAAVSWRILSAHGHRVYFATPEGAPAKADELMLSGVGLDPWGWLPGLRRLPLLGLLLRANRDARQAYAAMLDDPAFQQPLAWSAITPIDFDSLLLPGGHRARGMREYLESALLQACVADFFASHKPVAAICHGVLLAARSHRAGSEQSVLHGRRTTALTWALERKGWSTARLSRFWDPNYYRTYTEQAGQPKGYMSVQQEVTRALAQPSDFLDVPKDAEHYRRKTSGLARDSEHDATPAFIVRDGNYLSARWPGDAHTFAHAFAEMLTSASPQRG